MSVKENATFWRGFELGTDMVIDLLYSYDSNDLARLSVFDFLEKLREDIIKEVNRYKKEG